MTNQDGELTFAECQELDAFLEGYKNNPSNSNKWRIGLHAHVNELIHARETAAEKQGFQKCLMEFNSTEGMREAERRAKIEELKLWEGAIKKLMGKNEITKALKMRIAELTALSERSEE